MVVANGLLQKGLRTSIVSLAENTRDIISQFFKVGMGITEISKAINSALMKTSSKKTNIYLLRNE